jgi:high-affinity nickel-transport protein
LLDVFKAFRKVTRGGAYDEDAIDTYLNKRGLLARIFRPLFKGIDASWKMYPIGFLFGLGFDTASEIAILAIAGTSAAKGVPFLAIMLLPLLFTAGMSLADTTDGVMMLGAYGWAFVRPIRKLYYNLTITLISVLVALVVGTFETLSIIAGQLNLSGAFWDGIANINNNFGLVGAVIIGVFILSWAVSTLIYRVKRYEDLDINRQDPPVMVAGG